MTMGSLQVGSLQNPWTLIQCNLPFQKDLPNSNSTFSK